jgi:hypothetical protein
MYKLVVHARVALKSVGYGDGGILLASTIQQYKEVPERPETLDKSKVLAFFMS